ncbi:unnamed protein product, partial [Owenia fusiformis]
KNKMREIDASVQMRLYALSKRQFVLVFVTFFVCFGVSILIGLAGPPILQSVQFNATSLPKVPQDLKKGPFIKRSPPMSPYHQQLWLIAEIIPTGSKSTGITHPFTVSVQIRGSEKIKDENSSKELYDGHMHNRTRILQCKNGKCDELILLHLGFLDFTYYTISITFYDLEDSPVNVKDIKFFFKSYNPSFTYIEIWFRFVFLVFSFLATCLFAHSLRKFSMRDWSIEQKWMSVLLPLLLLYNNPIFSLTFLVNSWIPPMFDAIFQASFLCALLLFWLCLYHGVRQTKRYFCKFYLPKLLVVGLIWIAAVTIATWQSYNELVDPTYNYKLDTGNFMGFKIFFFVMGGVYILNLLYLLVRAYAELRSMPYFDLRLKFLTALMLVVLAISIAITALRFGVGVLRDNFVAQLSTHYQNSAEFLSFYGLLNFYLYTMAFVYSPTNNAMYESHFKDNPALSMLNDSDDEVIYGSDEERHALTTRGGRRIPESDEDAFN